MDVPKLVMKIKLDSNYGVEFNLIHLSDIYGKKNGNRFFFTGNNWSIYIGDNFSITRQHTICFPKFLSNRMRYSIKFYTDNERRVFLKGLSRALMFWSRSTYFSELTSYDDCKIKFHKNFWIVY